MADPKKFLKEYNKGKKVKKQDAKSPAGDRSIANALPSMEKSKVVMDKDEFIKEHKKLVNILESPSKRDDKKEAKKQKKELDEYVKKSYDFRNIRVSIDAKDQQAAEETSNRSLAAYIKQGCHGDMNKIPFPTGVLTLNRKTAGVYSGFFQDKYGQLVENFDDQTIDMVAKMLEIRELVPMPYEIPSTPSAQEASPDRQDDGPRTQETHSEHTEKEFRRSLANFINKFKEDGKVEYEKDFVKGAIKEWISVNELEFDSTIEAAEALMNEWDIHQETFSEILFAEADQDFKDELHRSIDSFISEFNQPAYTKDDIKKAIKEWIEVNDLEYNSAEAAEVLLNEWDEHEYSFSEILFTPDLIEDPANDLRVSVHKFIENFKNPEINYEKNFVKKAIKSWVRNSNLEFNNEIEAAESLLQNWETHQEGFNQILFAMQQGSDE